MPAAGMKIMSPNNRPLAEIFIFIDEMAASENLALEHV